MFVPCYPEVISGHLGSVPGYLVWDGNRGGLGGLGGYGGCSGYGD